MIRTILRNLSIFNNFQTIIVTFIIEPFFTVLFFYLINPSTNSNKSLTTAIILASIYTVISTTTQIFVYAQNIDILKRIFINVSGFAKFTSIAVIISIVVAFLQSTVLIIIYLILNFDLGVSPTEYLFILIMVATFSSLSAIISTIISIGKNNPYFGTNILMGILPIISATIVPMDKYPEWLAVISKILPFWLIQNFVWTNQINLIYIGVYFIIGIAIAYLTINNRRSKILES